MSLGFCPRSMSPQAVTLACRAPQFDLIIRRLTTSAACTYNLLLTHAANVPPNFDGVRLNLRVGDNVEDKKKRETLHAPRHCFIYQSFLVIFIDWKSREEFSVELRGDKINALATIV